MDVSIIIVNYNTRKLTLAAVKSIRTSSPKLKYEIIVVDNGSEEKMEKSRDYKLIQNSKNLGFARANNQGIKTAKGDYIFLLNSDTIVGRGAIEKMLEFAKETQDAGVIVPRLYNTNGTIQASCFRLPTIGLAIKQYILKEGKLLEKYFPRSEKPTEVEVAVMAAFLITPMGLKSVGRLNEKYFMYFEDLDYCREVKKTGLKIYYLPEARVVHIHGASGGKNEYLRQSAKKYFGLVYYYLYTAVLWVGQKI